MLNECFRLPLVLYAANRVHEADKWAGTPAGAPGKPCIWGPIRAYGRLPVLRTMLFRRKKEKSSPQARPSGGKAVRPQSQITQRRPAATTAPAKKLLGQLLIEEGLVQRDQLEEALAKQKNTGMRIAETLMELGHLDRKAYEHFLSGQPGVASIDLENYNIPRDLINTIPRELAIRHQVFPIDKLGKLLTIGMACPLDSKTIEELQAHTGLRVKALLCSLESIEACIKEYYSS